MSMYERILVASDLTEGSAPAIRAALDLARRTGASIIALHVTSPPYGPKRLWAPLGGEESRVIESVAAREREAAARVLEDQMRALCHKADVRPELDIKVLAGIAPDVICETAKSEHAGLIVMGTHGRTGLRHFLLGSTAERVVRAASCPVLTVRATDH